jgi:hypothetical protein
MLWTSEMDEEEEGKKDKLKTWDGKYRMDCVRKCYLMFPSVKDLINWID